MWEAHWYGYFLNPMIFIAMFFNGKEGKTGAGGETPRKFLGLRLFSPRKVPYLYTLGTPKRALSFFC